LGGSTKDFISQADTLLYQAKENGRNCIESDSSHTRVNISEVDKEQFVKLIWKDSFRSGNVLIDSQHQSLFKVANKLLDAALMGRSLDEISDIIANLIKDISQHFADEERILMDIKFPGLSKQENEHSNLLAKGRKILDEYNASKLPVGDVFQFLAYDVVMLHMLGSDREYLPYIGSSMDDGASTRTVS
jgi:hemerythrin-like metal-binding protein